MRGEEAEAERKTPPLRAGVTHYRHVCKLPSLDDRIAKKPRQDLPAEGPRMPLPIITLRRAALFHPRSSQPQSWADRLEDLPRVLRGR